MELRKMRDLLLEIGTEEIPARFIEPAKEGVKRLVTESLAAHRIAFGAVDVHGTPRRLAVIARDVAELQEEATIIKFGPPANRAFDEAGNPTKAAVGFARSQGVDVGDLHRREKDGVLFVAVEKRESGGPAGAILPGIVADIIPKIPFQKRMRWGAETFEFARPIQWLLVLFGDEPVSVTIADVTSGATSLGHRFLSPGTVKIPHPSLYRSILKDNHIVVDEDERLRIIREGIAAIEKAAGGKAVDDDELVKEILYITEYPHPLKGTFDESFLSLPKEVLVNVMKSHQRYIPLEDGRGNLLPAFIFFANTIPRDDTVVIRGNEKVLRARLADARFFFEEDLKTSLYDLQDRLSTIVFHVKIGTVKEKTVRTGSVARYVASVAGYGDGEKIGKAAKLFKSDLLTHMVGEFPELQGTMGRIYARAHGDDDDVAMAIEEHYLPAGVDGSLPRTELGTIMSIADKLDSLAAFFSVGITPTGNLDPYALRRQALGLMRIVIEKGLHIPLSDAIAVVYTSGEDIKGRVSIDETSKTLKEFISTRFKFSMIEENHNQDFIEAVLPYVEEDIYDGYLRLRALETQKSLDDFQRLMVGFRRVFNITKQLSGDMAVEKRRFVLPEEEALFAMYETRKEEYLNALSCRDYGEATAILVGFKETIDAFFEKVFVMDKDEGVKNNRLALLKSVKDMFLAFGDFSKIRVE